MVIFSAPSAAALPPGPWREQAPDGSSGPAVPLHFRNVPFRRDYQLWVPGQPTVGGRGGPCLGEKMVPGV